MNLLRSSVGCSPPAQDAIYRVCQGLVPEGSPFTSFTVDSSPYLWTTELPWAVLDELNLTSKNVLTIAGSGDLPIYFAGKKGARVIAVDISRPACYVNELKRAALKVFEWHIFLSFFWGGVKWIESWLRERGIFSLSFSAVELYYRCRPFLSFSARGYWDKIIVRKQWSRSPFSLLLRPTDILAIDEIPLLKREEYELYRMPDEGFYPIVNLPLHEALRCIQTCFDLIYCSNLLEYFRTNLLFSSDATGYSCSLRSFFRLLENSLKPSGAICFYEFTSCDNGKALVEKDLSYFQKKGCEIVRYPLRCSPSLFSGTILNHTLVIVKKKTEKI